MTPLHPCGRWTLPRRGGAFCLVFSVDPERAQTSCLSLSLEDFRLTALSTWRPPRGPVSPGKGGKTTSQKPALGTAPRGFRGSKTSFLCDGISLLPRPALRSSLPLTNKECGDSSSQVLVCELASWCGRGGSLCVSVQTQRRARLGETVGGYFKNVSLI